MNISSVADFKNDYFIFFNVENYAEFFNPKTKIAERFIFERLGEFQWIPRFNVKIQLAENSFLNYSR